MSSTLRQVLPVLISILILIVIAVLRNYSKTLAAVFATMPVNIPLSLWIIYGMDNTSQSAVVAYASTLVISIFPTVVFIIVAWLALRAGWSLLPTLGVGYLSWGALLVLLLAVRGGLQ